MRHELTHHDVIPLSPRVADSGRAKMAEQSDPLEPVAVSLATPGYDGEAAMARCFVEEFAMRGWPAERIRLLFQQADYVAAHSVYRARGAEFIDALIAEVLGEPGRGR
jgi:hypothetical protein